MADASGTYWDGVAAQEDALPDGWRRHARAAHVDLVRRWVGAPTGRWLKTDLFEERHPVRAVVPELGAASWVGIDVSSATVASARHCLGRSAPDLVVCDVRWLPFAGGGFDGVLSTSTLDHFEDRDSIEASVGELRRVLRRGGHLVLTLDNPGNPLVRTRNALPHSIARRTGLVPFAVGHTLDERTGRQVLEARGFEVVATEHLLHAPHVLGTRAARFGWWERRVLPWFDRLGETRAGPVTGHFVAFLAVAR